jgi:hypothetical protein
MFIKVCEEIHDAVERAKEKFKDIYHSGDFNVFDFEYCVIDLAKECFSLGERQTRKEHTVMGSSLSFGKSDKAKEVQKK